MYWAYVFENININKNSVFPHINQIKSIKLRLLSATQELFFIFVMSIYFSFKVRFLTEYLHM